MSRDWGLNHIGLGGSPGSDHRRIRESGESPTVWTMVSGEVEGVPDLTHLGNSLVIATPGLLRIFRVPREGTDVVFRVDALDDGKIRPVAASIVALDGAEVTASDWRAVNFQQLWQEHVGSIVMVKPQESDFESLSDDPQERLRQVLRKTGMGISPRPDKLELMRARGPVKDTLEHAASVYTLGQAIGVPPVKLVQEAFTTDEQGVLPRATATKWIRRAREAGLIKSSEAVEDPSDG